MPIITPGSGGGGSGGITQTYIGYNTIGGSTSTTNLGGGALRMFGKRVTLASSGTLASVGMYMQGNASNVISFGASVMTDSASAPSLVIAACLPSSGTAAATLSGFLSASPRWIDIPIGAFLATGTYWIVFITGNGATVYFDGSGTDVTAPSLTTTGFTGDAALITYTAGTSQFSLRGSVLR